MRIMNRGTLAVAFLLLLACSCSHRVVGIPLEEFYQFGSAAGDSSLPVTDDGFSAAIPLPMPFPFFDEERTAIFVNNNGGLSFGTGGIPFTPGAFPLMTNSNLQLIAPYWADVDTRGTGTVWYRETTDPQLLQRAGEEIQAAFISQGSFAPSYLFIATWERVGYFFRHTDMTNTFQCVMATDGINSFVIYLYADGLIQWTTGDASGGSGGLGGTPAQVGFNAGDGIRFFMLPDSLTPEIINITQTSNVGVPGVWIFRVDSEKIVVGGCSFEPDATLTLAPQVANVLGDTAVIVSGPCLEETDNITCVFDGVEVEGIFVNMLRSLCISPPLSNIGRRTFQLRVRSNGVPRFERNTVFFSQANFEEGSAVSIAPPSLVLQPSTSLTITWSPTSLIYTINPNSYTVDVSLYRLTDTYCGGTWTEIASLASGVPNTGEAQVTIPELSGAEVSPVAVRVGLGRNLIEQPINNSSRTLLQQLVQLDLRPGQWADVRYITLATSFHSLCDEWSDLQRLDVGDRLNDQVLPCPPTMNQARMDNRFSTESPLVSPSSAANTCFRQVIRGDECRPGSQCCYNNNGTLIAGTPDGGSVDKFSPQGPLRCHLDHMIEDVLPSIYCCQGSFPNCAAYYRRRPSTISDGYQFPVPACVYGDPHLVTLDGLKYTFNGNGEFVLIETADGSFTLQGRMVPATDAGGTDVPATVFSALVARQNGSDTVQFELSRRGLDVLVNGQRIELGDVPEQEFNNVVVRASGNNSLSARFANGAFIELEEENEIISRVFVSVPGSLQGVTQGLMGNFNGDTSDDFIPRSGNDTLPSNSSLQEIHEQFGITWIIDNAEDSLFNYRPGNSWSTFHSPSFTPTYQPMFQNTSLEDQANEICRGDSFCLFDIATTGRVDIGQSTLDASQTFELILNLSAPIVCDVPCENGACVANNTCSCAAGFTGERCSEPVVTECNTNPCENGAPCLMQAGSYLCICPLGFGGSLCQTSIVQECTINPCQNGGNCTGIVLSTYLCECSPGYSGSLCENEGTASPDPTTIMVTVELQGEENPSTGIGIGVGVGVGSVIVLEIVIVLILLCIFLIRKKHSKAKPTKRGASIVIGPNAAYDTVESGSPLYYAKPTKRGTSIVIGPNAAYDTVESGSSLYYDYHDVSQLQSRIRPQSVSPDPKEPPEIPLYQTIVQ